MATKFTTREYLKILDEKGYTVVPADNIEIKDVLALYTRIDELEAMVANLNEGAKIMHAFATGGESKLLADWQTEAKAQAADARDKKTDFNTPEIKEAEEVADNFNFDEIKPIEF